MQFQFEFLSPNHSEFLPNHRPSAEKIEPRVLGASEHKIVFFRGMQLDVVGSLGQQLGFLSGYHFSFI
jgi:hypothetical protein